MFQKLYHGSGNDNPNDVVSLNSGNAVIVGKTTSASSGDYDGFIIELNSLGNVLWSKVVGGSKFDEIKQIKVTSDGGFITLGSTKSYGNILGQPWVIKFDASGNLIWSRVYSVGSINEEIPNKIIALNDGGFAFIINTHYKTQSADGILVRTDYTGKVIWSKRFNNGDEDALTSLAVNKDTILVGGYAAAGVRQGTITKVSALNGIVYNSIVFSTYPTTDTEPISIDVTNDGYSFALCRYYHDPQGYYPYLILAKMNLTGEVTFNRHVNMTGSYSGYTTVDGIRVKSLSDNGFAYLYYDTTSQSSGEFVKFSQQGFPEWGKDFSLFDYNGRTTTTAFDTTKNGYVIVELDSNQFTNYVSKIRVFRTDPKGNTGDCSNTPAGDFYDTAKLQYLDFNWKSVENFKVSENTIAVSITNGNFKEELICESQTCDTTYAIDEPCRKTFNETVKLNLSNQAFDVSETMDGGYAIVGNYLDYFSTAPIITKLKSSGDVDWTTSPSAYYHEGAFTHIIATADGNLLIMGLDLLTQNHGIGQTLLLMKITPAGKILWSKTYDQSGYTRGYNFIETKNGDIILYLEFYSGNILMRINQQGQILWQHTTNNDKAFTAKLFIDDEDLYITAQNHNYENNSSGTLIAKFNATNGSVIWSKYLSETSELLSPLSINKINDTICVTAIDGGIINSYPVHDQLAFLNLSADGKFLSAFEVSTVNYSKMYESFSYDDNAPNFVVKTEDAGIVSVNQLQINNAYHFNISKFKTNGDLIWSKNYNSFSNYFPYSVKASGNDIIIVGQKVFSKENNRYNLQTFIIKVDEDGNIVSKASDGFCASTNFLDFKTEKYGVNCQDFAIATADVIFPITSSIYTPHNWLINSSIVPSCYTVNNCTSFKLTGPDTVCSNNTYTIKLEKNPECTAKPIWPKQPGYDIISYTDSSVTVKFNSQGDIKVQMDIDVGCKLQTISKNIFIPVLANSLNLGSDTAICGDNTITLNAGLGYSKYVWQDNSTDSLLKVHTAGVYYVSATDFCKNIFSDTIIVSKAGNFNFSIGNDTTICKGDTLALNASEGFINYNWEPSYQLVNLSARNVLVSPLSDTEYISTAEKWKGCLVVDTVQVKVNNPVRFTLGSDTSFCGDARFTLSAPKNFSNYLWNDGSTSDKLLVNATGAYFLTATDNQGCQSTDTITITVKKVPSINLGNDQMICLDQTYKLTPGNGFNTYLWQDGSTAPNLSISALGLYWVEVTDTNNCKASDSMSVTGYFPKPSNFLNSTDSICEGQSLRLNPNGNWNHYRWSNNAATPFIDIYQPGI